MFFICGWLALTKRSKTRLKEHKENTQKSTHTNTHKTTRHTHTTHTLTPLTPASLVVNRRSRYDAGGMSTQLVVATTAPGKSANSRFCACHAPP